MPNIFRKTFKFSIIISLLIIILWSFLKLSILSYGHFLEPTLYADSYRLAEQNQNNDLSLLRWIFSQHNEHRIVISRLISLIEVNIFKLSIGQSGLLQNLLLVLLSSGIWAYLNQKFFKDRNLKIITTLSGITLLLHPWQWENFFWEFQVPWFFINVLVLFGTLLLIQPYKNSSKNKHFIDLMLVIIPWLAIFSTGQGLAAAWALSFSSLIKNKYLGLKISLSSAFATLSYFSFLDYVKPERHPFNFDFLFPFVMLFGGVWHGLFILVIITCLIFYITRPKIPSKVLAPIIFPTLFSLIFSLMTTLSRSHLGLAAALSYRYTTHTLMIGLSSILLLGFIAENNKKYSYSPLIGLTTLFITLGSFPLITFNQNSPNFKKYTFLQMWNRLHNQKKGVKDKFLCIADKASFKKKNIDLSCDKKNFNLPYEYPENLGPDYFSNKLKIKPKGWHELHTLKSLNKKDNKIIINYNFEHISLLASKNLKIKGYAKAHSNLREKERFFILANYNSSKTKTMRHILIKIKNDKKSLVRNKLFALFEDIIPLDFEGYTLANISIETRNNSQIILDNIKENYIKSPSFKPLIK